MLYKHNDELQQTIMNTLLQGSILKDFGWGHRLLYNYQKKLKKICVVISIEFASAQNYSFINIFSALLYIYECVILPMRPLQVVK